jgi:hypothetical protein
MHVLSAHRMLTLTTTGQGADIGAHTATPDAAAAVTTSASATGHRITTASANANVSTTDDIRTAQFPPRPSNHPRRTQATVSLGAPTVSSPTPAGGAPPQGLRLVRQPRLRFVRFGSNQTCGVASAGAMLWSSKSRTSEIL